MKVGLILDGNIDFPGGVQTYVKGLYRFLVENGHQVLIIAGGNAGKTEEAGFKVIRVGKTYKMKGIGTQISAHLSWVRKKTVRRILEKENFDVIHLQALFGLLGMRFLDLSLAKKVATFHNYYEPGMLPLTVSLFSPLYRHYFKKLNGRIADSKPAEEFARLIEKGDYVIIPPGIEQKKFKKTSESDPSKKELVTILFMGRLDKRKGIMFLLDAFKKVQDEVSNTRLLIVGDGPQAKEAEKFVRKHKLDNVNFVGFVEDEDLPEFYAQADIYCSPACFGESFGIVLLEAMASSLPIVAFANAGYKEVIKGKGAQFLVEPKDTNGLTEALLTLIKNEELRKEISNWSLNEVQQYSWDRVGKKILGFYHKLL